MSVFCKYGTDHTRAACARCSGDAELAWWEEHGAPIAANEQALADAALVDELAQEHEEICNAPDSSTAEGHAHAFIATALREAAAIIRDGRKGDEGTPLEGAEVAKRLAKIEARADKDDDLTWLLSLLKARATEAQT